MYGVFDVDLYGVFFVICVSCSTILCHHLCYHKFSGSETQCFCLCPIPPDLLQISDLESDFVGMV